MKTITKKKRINIIQKGIKKLVDKAYKDGAISAMSIAVGMYNCEPRIRAGVFKTMKIKP